MLVDCFGVPVWRISNRRLVNGYNTKVLMLLYFLNQVSVETMMVTLETMFLGQTGILTDSVIVTGKYLTKSLGNVRN